MSDKQPILLIAFNRPNETRQVLEAIERYCPERIYVSLDGPRTNNATDAKNCQAVLEVLDSSPMRDSMIIRRSEENLGCKSGVVAGISWFFSHEVCGIIIEDDIIPHESFFSFQNKMLKAYEFEPSVKAVLGFNLYGQNQASNDHFLYEGFYPWGWGTWRDRWQEYDVSVDDLTSLKAAARSETTKKRYMLNSLLLNLNLIRRGHLDTWDYQFLYLLARTGGKCVAPYANLTRNIGINGAHSVGNLLDFKFGEMSAPEISMTTKSTIDYSMNERFYNEHFENRFVVNFKRFILTIGLYRIIKKSVQRLRNIGRRLS